MFALLATLVGCGLGLAQVCAQQARVPVPAFAKFNSMYSPQLSPDGNYLAISAELDEGGHAIRIVRIADMKQTAMLLLRQYEVPSRVRWVSETRLIVAKARKMGRREEPTPTGEIIAADFDGKNQVYIYGYGKNPRLRGLSPGFGDIAGVPEQPNGHFYMRRLSRSTNRSQLYDVDTENGTARLFADVPAPYLSFVMDHQGRPRYAHGSNDQGDYLLFAADAQNQWQQLSSEQMGGTFLPLAFTADDQQVIASFTATGEPAMLVQADVDGRNRKVLARDEFASFVDLEWTSRPLRPFAVTTGGGKPRQIYLEPDSADAKMHQSLSNGFPGQIATYINHTTNGEKSLVYVYSDRDAGSWYLLDRANRKVSLVLVGREGLIAGQMGERRPIRFKSREGVELSGFITLPAGVTGRQKLPMVLLPHGGPHGVSDEWAFDTDAQFLASRGYLVLQVNFRGSGGRGMDFVESGYKQWGTGIQDDLVDGVHWAIDQGYADPARICAYGASFGAYSAMMVAARAPELFKCVAGASGLYDLQMMWTKGDVESSRSGRNYLARAIGDDAATLRVNSPVGVAARIRVPVLLVHGEGDERTPFAQAKAMKAALEANGRPPEWMAVPKEGHGFYKESNNIAFYQRLEAFLDQHIGAQASQ